MAPDAPAPDTAIGQALLAHELTHVVQQSSHAGRPSLRAEHMEAVPDVGVAPPGMTQHSLTGCSSCEAPAPAPLVETTFMQVQAVYRSTADATQRRAALDAGITTARRNASAMYRGANGPPVSTLRERYERETGIDISYDNPLIGVTQDHVEQAYRAWAENPTGSEPPWVLLAVWVKEGLPSRAVQSSFGGGMAAPSAQDARARWRSATYFYNLGADVYIDHTAVAGSDNTASFDGGTGAAHDTAFRAQITRQVADGRLPRDLSAEIDAELAVTEPSPGRFVVTPSARFWELSLMLVDAFYREQRAALTADARVGADPDPGLVYMRWNMRSTSFDAFLNRASNPDPDGSVPSKTDWAFHRQVNESEYGQARRNAIRFKYLLEAFRHVYEGL